MQIVGQFFFQRNKLGRQVNFDLDNSSSDFIWPSVVLHNLGNYLRYDLQIESRYYTSFVLAALIASCDQGSVVFTFTLVLLVLKRFLWRVVLVILIFVAWLLVDLSCFCCLSSTNIMLFLCSHVSILC